MKPILVAFSLIVLFISSASARSNTTKLEKTDVSTWAGADAKAFGCFLEKEFNHRDRKFNCGLKAYKNQGDPCKNTKAYYEGPRFPADKAKNVDRDVKSIDLSWEHGALQQVLVTMKGKWTEAGLRAKYKLPASARIEDCGDRQTCVVIVGFDHMGAGDVDCGS